MKKQRYRLHRFGDNRCKFFVRLRGQTLKFISFTDWSVNAEEGGVRYIKRLPETARLAQRPFGEARNLCRGRYSEAYAAWWAALPVGQWEVIGD
ncbi:MAG: hypothetical protein ACT4QA_17525 [Panacagrimonas sp.]